MRRLLLGAVLLAVFCCWPSSIAADWRTEATREHTAITAAAATTDQTSAVLTKPTTARGMVVIVDVTVGSTLLLDLQVLLYSPGLADTIAWSQVCPSADGITGVSETVCVFYPSGQTNKAGSIDEDFVQALPTATKLFVDHGNVNEATYVVYYRWLY